MTLPVRYSVWKMWCLCLLLQVQCSFGFTGREANTTLAVPDVPAIFGYQLVNAFPGVTFTRPTDMVAQPGETNKLFVLEQAGNIFVITNLAAPSKKLFMNNPFVRSIEDEEGLLGMAFHPDWASNGYFYLALTINTTTGAGSGRHQHLVRFDIDPSDQNAGDPDSHYQLISQYDEQWNHNGGDLEFGPDGYLYYSVGDEGGLRDQYRNSRRIDKDFHSAILRLDVDKRSGSLPPNPHPSVHYHGGEPAYHIPQDNPFIGANSFNGSTIDPDDVRTEFWAAGLRNPWRMTFDPETGVLYCADVGEDAYEEVNIIIPGRDYGWEYREGLHAFIDNDGDDTPPAGVVFEDPVLEYPHVGGASIPGGVAQGMSITGGIVYRGERMPQLWGYYVFADYVAGRVFAAKYNEQTGQMDDFRQLGNVSQPVSLVADPSNGDVLILSRGGSISRLIYSDTPVAGEEIPSTLSATGSFSDLSSLTPEQGIVPYEINVPFWSDHAIKSRWFSIPDVNDTMMFDTTGNWTFPSGTVWIKHFDLELTNGVAASKRRLETRFIVKNDDGVHGFTYKWNAEETDADLVNALGEDEDIPIYDSDGSLLRTQTWRYPARSECLQCHTPTGGYAAGFNTVQLNKQFDYGNGPVNQIEALSSVGYFDSTVTDVEALPALAAADDESASLEYRVRSYLQANCVSCHQPGAVGRGSWDARISTPIEDAGLVNGELVNDGGDPENKVIVPGDVTHSMLLQRIEIRGPGQMPPLASNELDEIGVNLLTDWINSLSTGGPEVPVITWSDPAPISYGQALSATELNATADVLGTFDYSPDLGVVLPAGMSQQLSVTFTPDDTVNYTTAQASVSIDVFPAALTITAEDKAKVYGESNPELTATYSGFVNGEGEADLDTGVTLSTTADSGSSVGDYPITVSGADDGNYAITQVDGTLSVTAATLTITAEDKSRAYGSANPALTASYEGFVNGEGESDLDTGVTLGTTAEVSSVVGDYPITANGAVDENYTITQVDGTLSVTAAPLTITAEDKTKVAGQPNPTLTASYEGFVNGESDGALDELPMLSTTATVGSSPGIYPISVSGGLGVNYSIKRVNGTLTVESNAEFADLSVDDSNRVILRLTGHPGREYRVQYSVDLETWLPFATVSADPSGVAQFVEESEVPDVTRYFRVLWP